MKDLRAALALSFIKDIGPATAKLLIDAFGSPGRIFDAGEDELTCINGIGRTRANNILSFTDWGLVDGILERCQASDINLTCYGSGTYPALLSQITDPPMVLYHKGHFDSNDKFSVAVVGSRRSSEYGKRVAQSIAEELSSAGLTIISGMARGIDSVAHRASLHSGGRTISVLGSGIDVIYPPENRGLYERIPDSGVVISEFPIGTAPLRENFPQRNRLISGLSLGVIVVEASRGSGTLITAQYALEQNREVFAVPGNITSPISKGTNHLIKNGAKPLTHPNDVIEDLAPLMKGFIRSARNSEIEITDEEKSICDILSGDPVHIDDITRRAGIPPSQALGLLLGLELKSLVRQVAGKKFFLAREDGLV